MKKILSVILLFLFLLCGCGCNIFDDSITKEDIVSYFNSNFELISSFDYDKMPENNKDNLSKREAYIADFFGKNTIIKKISEYDEGIIKFYCGGKGLATNSEYVGFYYSKENVPHGFEFNHHGLTETSPGMYEWKNSDGSHSIYTERIVENWFYYHMVYN